MNDERTIWMETALLQSVMATVAAEKRARDLREQELKRADDVGMELNKITENKASENNERWNGWDKIGGNEWNRNLNERTWGESSGDGGDKSLCFYGTHERLCLNHRAITQCVPCPIGFLLIMDKQTKMFS